MGCEESAVNAGAASRTGALLVLGWRRGRELLIEDVKLGNSGCSLCKVFRNPASPAHPALSGAQPVTAGGGSDTRSTA